MKAAGLAVEDFAGREAGGKVAVDRQERKGSCLPVPPCATFPRMPDGTNAGEPGKPQLTIRMSELDEDEYFAFMVLFGNKDGADPRIAEGARNLLLGESEGSVHARTTAGVEKLMARGAIVQTGPEDEGYRPLRSVARWVQDVRLLSQGSDKGGRS